MASIIETARDFMRGVRRDESVSNSVLIMVAVSFVLLIVAGGLAFTLARRSAEAEDWIAHTMSARREARSLLVELLNAETSERGFVITRDEAFLGPFAQADARVASTFSDLLGLTADNGVQQARLLLLEPKIKTRMAELRDNIDLVREGQPRGIRHDGPVKAHLWRHDRTRMRSGRRTLADPRRPPSASECHPQSRHERTRRHAGVWPDHH